MSKSLQEQLLQAGVVDKERAAQLKKAKHKRVKQRQRDRAGDDDVKISAERARGHKAARDRALNAGRQAEAAQKAAAAEARQLIERHRIDATTGAMPYNFSDAGIVRKIHVTVAQQAALADGRIALVRFHDTHVLVPAAVAAKVRARDPGAVLVANTADKRGADEDDEYAGFQVPDDLTW